jgi:dipicolinate synthase subunit B
MGNKPIFFSRANIRREPVNLPLCEIIRSAAKNGLVDNIRLLTTDTPVTMAVKSHIRNARPVVLCVATNDALSGSAKNIGKLLNAKHYFFVPMKQDNYEEKPTSMVAQFELIAETLIHALNGKQIEPIMHN